MAGVQLLGAFFSPFVNRVQIAFNLKSVELDYVEETVLSCKSNLLLESNPVHRMVPVLIHDEKIICESLIIVQYIDDVWTNNGYSILSSDPYDRAVARFWAAYVDDMLVPMLKELLVAEGEEKIALRDRIGDAMVFLEEAFVKCSKGKAYFGGDNIGYLDIALGSGLEFIKSMEKISGMKLVEKAKTPELVAWADRFMSHEAVKNVLPETEKFVEVLKIIQKRLSEKAETPELVAWAHCRRC